MRRLVFGCAFLSAACTLAAAGQNEDHSPMIIAHRGASAGAPENTLAAFKLAWQLGADGIEGDFYLTRDGHIVCIHDRTTKRVANKDLVVADSRLEELRALDVGSWKAERWTGERIPTLQEVLATMPDGKRIYIEIKCGVEIVPPLVDVLRDADIPCEDTVIIAFDKDVVAKCKEAMPDRPALLLVEFKKDKKTGKTRPDVKDVVDTLRKTRADGAGVNAVDPDLADAARRAGKQLNVWTVDDPKMVPRLLDLGVSSITTNRPAVIRRAARECRDGQ